MVDSSTYLPQDIARRQKMAEALLYGAVKPRAIHNVGEGIAQMGQALLGGLMTRKANEAEATGRKSASDAVARALAGYSAPSDGLPQVSPVATPTQPQTISGGGDFTSNAIPTDYFNSIRAAESGGSDTADNPRSSAFGRYQFTTGTWGDLARNHPELGLTPDGRSDPQQQERAIRAFTADNAGKLRAAGVPVTGGSLYAAHFLGAGAAPAVWKAPDNALVANFVDPGVIQANPFLQGMTAAQFRDWATSKGGGVAPSGVAENAVTPMGQPNLAANLPPIDPESGMTVDQAALPTARPASLNRTMPMAQALAAPNATAPVSIPDNNPLRSNQQQSAGDFARADARRRMAMAMSGGQMPSVPPPMTGSVPSAPVSQPSPAMGAPMQNAPQQAPQSNPQQGNRLQALMAAAQNPYLTPAQASVINAAIKMEVERNAPQKPVEVNDRLVDPMTGRVIADFSDGGKAPTVTDFYDEKTGQAYKAQWNPKTQTWDRVGGVKAPNGTSLTVGPDGQVSFTQGGVPKAPTESQSKTITYITRAAGALPTLDHLADHLTKFGEGVGAKIPLVGNYLKSPEYQQAEQAGREFLQALLRKDTGATITKEETAEYGVVYLPQPGDSVAVLKQKRVARHRALKAMELGLPPQQILSLEREGVDTSGGNAMPEQPTTRAEAPAAQDGGPAKPTTQQEFGALPSGAVYVDPDDGKTYRKR